MKKIYIILLMCVCALGIQAQDYKELKRIQIFGVALSLNDSVAYITDVMPLDSTWMQKKTHFLYARNEYSNQYNNFVRKNKEVAHPVTSVSFAMKQKKLQKKYDRMVKKLQKSGYLIKTVPAADFQFTAVKYEIASEEVLTKEQKKALRKAAKEQQKAKKDKNKGPKGRPERPQGNMPPGGGMPGGGMPGGGMPGGGPGK